MGFLCIKAELLKMISNSLDKYEASQQAWLLSEDLDRCLSVCLLQDASGHSNVLKAGKAEELENARKRRNARKASYIFFTIAQNSVDVVGLKNLQGSASLEPPSDEVGGEPVSNWLCYPPHWQQTFPAMKSTQRHRGWSGLADSEDAAHSSCP